MPKLRKDRGSGDRPSPYKPAAVAPERDGSLMSLTDEQRKALLADARWVAQQEIQKALRQLAEEVSLIAEAVYREA